MASDVKFQVKKAADEQALIPATISEEFEQKFIKKARSSSIKLIPISFIVAAVVLAILFALVYFLRLLAISTIAILFIIFPIYSIYDAIATSKAIRNHDYEFFYGEVINKTDNGNYQIKGLGDLKISVLFGKKDYNPGDKAVVARIKDDLHLISEE